MRVTNFLKDKLKLAQYYTIVEQAQYGASQSLY